MEGFQVLAARPLAECRVLEGSLDAPEDLVISGEEPIAYAADAHPVGKGDDLRLRGEHDLGFFAVLGNLDELH